MPLFASARERRLWLSTAAVLLAIWSTLGLARTLAGTLRDEGLLNTAFGLGVLLVALAVVAQGLRRRPGGFEIGVATGVAAVYLLVFARMGVPEERTHLIEYGVVALLVHEALAERGRSGRPVRAPVASAILFTTALGVVDEAIQAVIPSRVFDPVDMLFNAGAAVMAVTALVAVRWARRTSLERVLRGGKAGI